MILKDLIIKELNKKLENLEILDQDRRALLEKVRSDRGIVEKCVSQNTHLKKMFDEHVEKIKELVL